MGAFLQHHGYRHLVDERLLLNDDKAFVDDLGLAVTTLGLDNLFLDAAAEDEMGSGLQQLVHQLLVPRLRLLPAMEAGTLGAVLNCLCLLKNAAGAFPLVRNAIDHDCGIAGLLERLDSLDIPTRGKGWIQIDHIETAGNVGVEPGALVLGIDEADLAFWSDKATGIEEGAIGLAGAGGAGDRREGISFLANGAFDLHGYAAFGMEGSFSIIFSN